MLKRHNLTEKLSTCKSQFNELVYVFVHRSIGEWRHAFNRPNGNAHSYMRGM
jgi:hypothetical protein